MPDDLYDRDILIWSERQANLLRRLAAGERVNADIDWTNVIEEVESVGRSELHRVESLLLRALVHLMKLATEPESQAAAHWTTETVLFLRQARTNFAPSMRQRIDLTDIYATARRATHQRPQRVPADCPFMLDDLLAAEADIAELAERLRQCQTTSTTATS